MVGEVLGHTEVPDAPNGKGTEYLELLLDDPQTAISALDALGINADLSSNGLKKALFASDIPGRRLTAVFEAIKDQIS